MAQLSLNLLIFFMAFRKKLAKLTCLPKLSHNIRTVWRELNTVKMIRSLLNMDLMKEVLDRMTRVMV